MKFAFKNPVKTFGWKMTALSAALMISVASLLVWGLTRSSSASISQTVAQVPASKFDTVDFSKAADPAYIAKQLQFNDAVGKKFAGQAKINADQGKIIDTLQQQLDAFIAKAQKPDPKVAEQLKQLQKQIDDLNALQLSGAAKVSEVLKKQESILAQLASFGSKAVDSLNPVGSAYAQTAPPPAQVSSTRYDRVVAECPGIKLDPSQKEADKVTYNEMDNDAFNIVMVQCERKRLAARPTPAPDSERVVPPAPAPASQEIARPAPDAASPQRSVSSECITGSKFVASYGRCLRY